MTGLELRNSSIADCLLGTGEYGAKIETLGCSEH